MAAVMAAEVDHGYTWRHIDSLLEDWGTWIERNADWTGYPSQSAIFGVVDVGGEFNWFRVRQFTAMGQSNLIFGGHRVLCYEMPERIRATNLMVGRLSDDQYDAVLARYALGVRDDGLKFTMEDKARALGITIVALEERLRRARARLLEILALATG